MARLNKAARGKHRWIGIRIGQPIPREGVKSVLRDALGDLRWRLFDVNQSVDSSLAIIRVRLEDYPSAVSNLNATASISTVTSSGKIRLVRSRLSVFEISE
jgi:hypothetical protein